MNQQIKDKICRHLDTEIEKIANMPSLNDVSFANLHKLTDTKKNLLKIEKLEMELEGMDGGNSYRGDGYSYGGPYYGNSMMGNSYAQGQRGGNSNTYMPMNPQYYDNGGYARMDAYSHLEAAMRDARSDQEREEIRQLMSRYHN